MGSCRACRWHVSACCHVSLMGRILFQEGQVLPASSGSVQSVIKHCFFSHHYFDLFIENWFLPGLKIHKMHLQAHAFSLILAFDMKPNK